MTPAAFKKLFLFVQLEETAFFWLKAHVLECSLMLNVLLYADTLHSQRADETTLKCFERIYLRSNQS